MADPGGPVTVSWSTSEPYQSTIDSCGKHGARVRGLTIRHRSPSVANNYAVFLQGSDLALEDCDVSSATGSGLGIEGGSPAVVRCTVHDCERHGIAIFSELGGSAGGGRIEGCRIASNKLDGVLVRDGADPMVTSNVILQNGGHGASLKGCTGRYSGNKLSGNGKGSVLVDALADVDIDEVESQNAFDKPITLL